MEGNNFVPEFTKEMSSNVVKEVSKIVVGQHDFIEKLVIVMLSGGHALIEGVPGIAKTLTAKTISKTVGADFKRLQFTPDLMPADVIGTKVYDLKEGNFHLKKGPLFTNLFLADEINRTPPKTQSALLEAMEERAITIDGETHVLSEPFMVIATQNPVEYEGTYPLPEAQLDRFMVKLFVDYPPQSFENTMLDMFHKGFNSSKIKDSEISVVMTPEDIKKCQEEIKRVDVSEGVRNYITSIVRATRNSPSLVLGASPRASIAMLLAAKTTAAVSGRGFVTPDDVKDLALSVLRHRIVLKPEAGVDGMACDDVIVNILNRVEVPR